MRTRDARPHPTPEIGALAERVGRLLDRLAHASHVLSAQVPLSDVEREMQLDMLAQIAFCEQCAQALPARYAQGDVVLSQAVEWILDAGRLCDCLEGLKSAA